MPLYQRVGKEPPSIDRLKGIEGSGEYRQLAEKRDEAMWGDALSSVADGGSNEARKHVRGGPEDVLSGLNIGYQGIFLVLRILGEQDGLKVALGLVMKRWGCFEDYRVRMEGEEEEQEDGIVWLVNDGKEEDEEGGVSHWSGVAPDGPDHNERERGDGEGAREGGRENSNPFMKWALRTSTSGKRPAYEEVAAADTKRRRLGSDA
ncbi:hypothetical protein K458DRAFT_410082 [Lentithecium fluviatile CBS 122367]|uniref:Uncharacterized protein n=1 Tax=Lentithecium fluviatile CBS 122367 TaxID=1168545 RepID=A0A6G1IFZ3_9PLEO|nr:hypothetical protein K458DRAFT_410082 [Lentithecium fluviatile CBS 122367]